LRTVPSLNAKEAHPAIARLFHLAWRSPLAMGPGMAAILCQSGGVARRDSVDLAPGMSRAACMSLATTAADVSRRLD
jgi:hypothetical protein